VYAGPISNVAVANGRFFGGGLEIAPEAQVDDGQLDVIVLGDFSRRALIRHARRFYDGTHLRLDDVSAFRGRCITATPHSDAPVRLDVDGEALGRLPATFTVRPRALRIQY
jgi:diacylglycerol kinase family enzyme